MPSKIIQPDEPIGTVAGLQWAIDNAGVKDQGQVRIKVRVTFSGKIKSIEFISPPTPPEATEQIVARYRPDGPQG